MTSFIAQPDARTCQATCIAMALALGIETESDVYAVRSSLENIGEPGNPYVMGDYLRSKIGDRYSFELAASIAQMAEWLKDGEFLITHGWFTGSGHVIGLNAVQPDWGTLGVRFLVSDPWSEFDFQAWKYHKDGPIGFQGAYSALGIYAAAVVGESVGDAEGIYNARKLDVNRSGAWVHRIRSAK